MKEPEFPICPVCGAETDTYYRDINSGEIVGCDECIESVDAWDTQPTDKI